MKLQTLTSRPWGGAWGGYIERAKKEGLYKRKQVAKSSIEEYRKVVELVNLGMSKTKAIGLIGMNSQNFIV
ncbi:hypothetical protein AB4170_25340 [Vibrio splendidus]